MFSPCLRIVSLVYGRCPCKLSTLFAFLSLVTLIVILLLCSAQPDGKLNIAIGETYLIPNNYTKNDVHKIPLLFHQMWKSTDVPADYVIYRNSCINLNQQYKTILWTDEMMYNFIAKEYPWFFNVFVNYPYHIQRVDVARYFILFHYGGVYLDIDVQCKSSFAQVFSNMTTNHTVFLPQTDIYGLTNSFMAARPRSEFFQHVIYQLPIFFHGRFNIFRHSAVIFSTGSLFISFCVKSYTKQYELYIMNLNDYNYQHFQHAKGGSWHKLDTEIVDIFHFHYLKLIISIIIIGFLVVFVKKQQIAWSRRLFRFQKSESMLFVPQPVNQKPV